VQAALRIRSSTNDFAPVPEVVTLAQPIAASIRWSSAGKGYMEASTAPKISSGSRTRHGRADQAGEVTVSSKADPIRAGADHFPSLSELGSLPPSPAGFDTYGFRDRRVPEIRRKGKGLQNWTAKQWV